MRPLLYVCRRVRVFTGERERESEREFLHCERERERERVGVSVLSTMRLSSEVRAGGESVFALDSVCESGRLVSE